MLAADDARTTNSTSPTVATIGKTQGLRSYEALQTLQQLPSKAGKPCPSRRAAHVAALNQLPQTASPPESDYRLKRTYTRVLAKAWILSAAGATARLPAGSTGFCRSLPASESVGLSGKVLGIRACVGSTCPCCDAVDMHTQHAPRKGVYSS